MTALFAGLAFATPISPKEEADMLSAQWKLPSQFSLKRVQSLLNEFTQSTYSRAFRFIGVEEDFFHGHILFERKLHEGQLLLHPRAILYHTQEEAHKAHWEKTIDSQFDYIEVTGRNWIQWLSDEALVDGKKIENARGYLDFSQKDPAQFFKEGAAPQQELHYTIHAKNLDSKKLGFQLAGEMQFEFYRADETAPSNAERSIVVSLPHEDQKLHLFTQSIYLDRQQSSSP